MAEVDPNVDDGEPADEPISGQEEALKAELEEQTLQLEALKKKVEELRAENELLQEEAHQTRVESHEYMSYMEKKSRKRQTVIISLNDRNLKELQDTSEQREKMMADFENKKAAVQCVLLEKEKQLAALRREMEELAKYQTLQEEQEKEISRLKAEVSLMKEKHTERTQALKAEFLHSQTRFEKEERARVGILQRQANTVANQYLQEYISSVCSENRALRNELHQLMDRHKELGAKKSSLNEQHKELLRELQVQRDLSRLYIGADTSHNASSGAAKDTQETAKQAGFLPQLQLNRTVTT